MSGTGLIWLGVVARVNTVTNYLN